MRDVFMCGLLIFFLSSLILRGSEGAVEKIFKVVARAGDGSLVSAIAHNASVKYGRGELAVPSVGRLFGFRHVSEAKAFLDGHFGPVDWAGKPEIWEALASGVRPQETCLASTELSRPLSLKWFWDGRFSGDPRGFISRSPVGTVGCEGILLQDRVW